MKFAKLFLCLAIILTIITCTTEVISEYEPSGGGDNSSSSNSGVSGD